jgi:tellurite resistance protein TehA-like permease
MEKKNLVVLILISVILVVLASVIIPIIFKTPQPGPAQNPGQNQNPIPQQQPRPAQQLPTPMENLKTVISFINIGLIIPLFIIYAGIYRKMRSSFTLGLMAVIFALGMYAITSNPLLVSLLGGRPDYIGVFQIVPDLCATAALVILIWISLE